MFKFKKKDLENKASIPFLQYLIKEETNPAEITIQYIWFDFKDEFTEEEINVAFYELLDKHYIITRSFHYKLFLTDEFKKSSTYTELKNEIN